jgi:transposase
MAYREVTMLEIKEVLRQWLMGTAKRRIARRVGVSRNTVRRYLEVAEACGLAASEGEAALTDERLAEVIAALEAQPVHERGDSWARCAQQRTFIEAKLREGVRLTKVGRLLQRQGVEVPYSTLHRFACAELSFGRGAPTIPVADCQPGEEIQVDTGWMIYLEPDEHGKRRRFRAWIFTSVYSRHRFVFPCLREQTSDAIEACEAAWAFFGGIFRVLIPDNTKAIVQKADPIDPLINSAFLEYAQARGFVVDPTRSKAPKDKARVERSVPTARDDCFGGEKLKTIEEARRRAVHWCMREYGMRRHTRTQRLPLEHFEAEEKSRLLPAPQTVYEVPLWCEPKVARDQHAEVAKALYSLPRRFLGRRLRARADRSTVRFYDGKELVKVHPLQGAGGRSTDPTDFPADQAACALRDIAFLERKALSHGEPIGNFAKALLQGPLPWTRVRRVYALLGLCKRYGDARVAAACAQALEVEMVDVRRLERMLKLGRSLASSPPSEQAPAKVILLARYLRPPKQYALPFGRGDEDHQDGGAR